MSGFMEKLLKYTSLFRSKGYIGGEWVSSTTKKDFLVQNPFNNKDIGSLPNMNEADTDIAINFASEAFQSWKKTTGKERSALLRNWYDLMMNHIDDLATIITVEAGKPLAEAKGEVVYGASYIEWYAEEAKRLEGEILQSPASTKKMLLFREPIGVAGLITPWNFPNAMITRKAAAALACGCTCVARPSEDTPYSTLAIAALAEEAGLPKGTFNVVTSSRDNAGIIGKKLCESSKVAGISFTGSTLVGKLLYRECAGGIKRLSLELGGNAPFIVFNSADLKTAVDSIMVAKFRNGGQACISANRVFVQSEIYDRFIKMLEKSMKERLIVGDPLQPGVTMGPLINKKQFDRICNIVNESVKKGSQLLMGGEQHAAGELFYKPTIMTECNSSMPCFSEEIFGPVVCIQRFEKEDDVIMEVNSVNSGLAGYFFSQDVTQVFRVAEAVQAGMIGVNEGLISAAEAPFGGMKESGLGREGSKHGIDEYTYYKYVCLGNIK